MALQIIGQTLRTGRTVHIGLTENGSICGRDACPYYLEQAALYGPPQGYCVLTGGRLPVNEQCISWALDLAEAAHAQTFARGQLPLLSEVSAPDPDDDGSRIALAYEPRAAMSRQVKVLLGEAVWVELSAMAEREEIPLAELMRRAAAELLQRQRSLYGPSLVPPEGPRACNAESLPGPSGGTSPSPVPRGSLAEDSCLVTHESLERDRRGTAAFRVVVPVPREGPARDRDSSPPQTPPLNTRRERESLSSDARSWEAERARAFANVQAAYPGHRQEPMLDSAVFEQLWKDGVIRPDDDPRAEAVTVSELLARIRAYMASDEWTTSGRQYVPGLSKFLRTGRFLSPPPRPRQSSLLAELQAPGERDEAPELDIPARLRNLAALVPPEIAQRVADLHGDAPSVEAALSVLDREMLATAGASLDPELRREVDAAVQKSIAALSGRLPAEELESSRERLTLQELRQRLKLPALSLFSPAAGTPEAER